MMRTLVRSALPALLALTVAAPAALADHPSDLVLKTARRGDPASSYALKSDGSMFRTIGNQLCQVTAHVEEMKIAQHPSDSTAAYFVRDGALVALQTPTPDDVATGGCPKAATTELVHQLARAGGSYVYKLVDRSDTPISLIAEDASGRVTAWDRDGVAVYVDGVVDVKMNSCFGAKKKSFSSYVAFAIDGSGHVSKLGGKDPRKSKLDPAIYSSLAQFEATNHVCR